MFSLGDFGQTVPDGFSVLDHGIAFLYLSQGEFMTQGDIRHEL